MQALNTGPTVTGQLDIVLYDSGGDEKDRREVNNLVVDAGLDVIADRMKGTPTNAAMTHMGVGTSGTAAGASDTDLLAISGSRVALDSTGVSGAVITYICTFGAGVSTAALQEAGIFNASSAGDMLCRATFTTINKGASDSLVITWTVTIS
jgi:hypothetical protein